MVRCLPSRPGKSGTSIRSDWRSTIRFSPVVLIDTRQYRTGSWQRRSGWYRHPALQCFRPASAPVRRRWVNLQRAIATFQLRFQRIGALLGRQAFDQLIEAFGWFQGGKIINQFVYARCHTRCDRSGRHVQTHQALLKVPWANQHDCAVSFPDTERDLGYRAPDRYGRDGQYACSSRSGLNGRSNITELWANWRLRPSEPISRTQQHLGAGVFFGEPCAARSRSMMDIPSWKTAGPGSLGRSRAEPAPAEGRWPLLHNQQHFRERRLAR